MPCVAKAIPVRFRFSARFSPLRDYDACNACDSPIERRAQAEDRRPFLRPPPPSPGSVPIERRSSPCSAASSRRRAKYGRDASGSSVNGGIVIRPADARRAARDERAELVRRDAALALPHPRKVHLDEDLGLRRRVALELGEHGVGRDRVDQAHQRQDALDLAALQVADEVPGEAIAPALALRLQVLQPVLADQRRPRPRPGRPSRPRARTWSPRGSPPPGRRLERTRSRLRRTPDRGRRSGSAIAVRQTSPAWRPVTPLSRRWEKKSSALHFVQRSADSTSADTGAVEQAARHLGQIEHAPVGDAVAERSEGRQHLVADLVAAAPDPGTDRAAIASDRLHPAGHDPGRQAAPAAVDHRHTAWAAQRHRQAVGDEDERRQTGRRRRLAVHLAGSTLPGSAKPLGSGGSSRTGRRCRAPGAR